MKSPVILLFVLPALMLNCTLRSDINYKVNACIGDISFISRYNHKPNSATDEALRINTHLEYVEKILRQKDVSFLTNELKEKRMRLLSLLNEYIAAGIYPVNYDYPGERRPCFIDKTGRICAVGYLIEKTAGRQIAEEINNEHKYDYILSMNSLLVDNWIATSGLTKEECAMIQPAYSPQPTYNNNFISQDYGIASAVSGGINISLNAINAIQMCKGTNDNTIGIISLVTGAGSIALGINNLPTEKEGFYHTTNESQKALSFINIGIGTTTMIMGIANLATNKKQKPTAFNFYSYPTAGDEAGFGIVYTKRF